ncbi:Tim10/DDP family zinc finger-domain-containing protein [Bisporella sp. PMI_857]|nr:Tim10/DDP family zinc finger-domain-containing protein [Bisporella sp. PMI_857]
MDPQSTLEQNMNVDLSALSAKDKAELQQFIVNESQRARVQQSIHALTDTCFKKCVTGTIRSSKLDRGEESCTANCVDRFMDANWTVLKHLDDLRRRGAV